MPLIPFDNLDVSLPVSVGTGASEEGPRLGGRAPNGVIPSGDELRYFFTVPLPDVKGVEVSVFMDMRDTFVFAGTAGKVLAGAGIDVVRHAVTARGTEASRHDSEVSEHPLVLGEPRADMTSEDGEEVPFSNHKMGGRPYFVQGEPVLEDEVNRLMASGFVHLAQIDFPGNEGDADVSGSWPVGTALFHVLTRDGSNGFEWRCFWEV